MRIGKGMKQLVMNGKWSIGWISPNNILYVTKSTNEHDIFLKLILGKIVYNKLNYNYEPTQPFYDGWVRLINGTTRKDFDSGVLGVNTYISFYKIVRKEIEDFLPFYRYFHTIYFDILSRYGWMDRKIKLKDIGKSEELFSLLDNPRRGR